MTHPVVLLGADGFIGRHIAFGLRARGYTVRAVARRCEALEAMGFEAYRIDLEDPRWHNVEAWRPLLGDGAHLINAAGLLTGSEAAFEAVHVRAPEAAYGAMTHGARGVLISATGVEGDTEFATPFAVWRRAGERAVPRHFAVLRPGLVMAETSYGGTSLARALASLPGVVPVVGAGEQAFNPIHAEDLADIAIHCLEERLSGAPMAVGGPEVITQTALAQGLRGWMGLAPGRVMRLPVAWAEALGTLGDLLRLGPISATAVRQLETGVLAPMDARLSEAPAPRGVFDILEARPAGTQDLWHARLYLMRPSIRLTLAFMWFVSGLLGLLLPGAAFLPALPGAPDWLALLGARAGGSLIWPSPPRLRATGARI
ncbi:hypothetical protein ACS3SW_06850 [Roseobacteraceae bacterium S113]